MADNKPRVAVILFNLGGPDDAESVRPFLFNLFRDKAIISLPGVARLPIAALISTLRASSARDNYALMGGGSPLREETERQAAALTEALAQAHPAAEWRCLVAMRYWKPFVADAAREAEAWNADEVILLPLYPHFSTTTTDSSFGEWDRRARLGPDRRICCYPLDDGLVAAHVALIRETFEKAGSPENARLLFSAHGLPERTVAKGDPYPWQVERTAQAIAKRLPEISDWALCYQSRVGPLEWIGPSTEDEITRAAEDAREIILSPIAFVSEHIETLVELDIEYAKLAEEAGAPGFHRVPALGAHPEFIGALARLAMDALAGPKGLKPPGGARLCPADAARCPCNMDS